DGPPPRFIHSVQTGVALMHGGSGCNCEGMANPAIRRIVCSTVLSPGAESIQHLKSFPDSRARLIQNGHWRRIPESAFKNPHFRDAPGLEDWCSVTRG